MQTPQLFTALSRQAIAAATNGVMLTQQLYVGSLTGCKAADGLLLMADNVYATAKLAMGCCWC
jgi:hypothetical protein